MYKYKYKYNSIHMYIYYNTNKCSNKVTANNNNTVKINDVKCTNVILFAW